MHSDLAYVDFELFPHLKVGDSSSAEELYNQHVLREYWMRQHRVKNRQERDKLAAILSISVFKKENPAKTFMFCQQIKELLLNLRLN